MPVEKVNRRVEADGTPQWEGHPMPHQLDLAPSLKIPRILRAPSMHLELEHGRLQPHSSLQVHFAC